ncbi:MAG: DMT family transporter [Alphaproteobacteria bacterium]|nr:DMT family transporter [Alphaproteobacteria bacterium]
MLGITWGAFFSLSRFAGETRITPMVLVAYIILAELPFFYLICWRRGRFPRIWRPVSMIFYLMAITVGYFIPAVLELQAAPIIGAGLLTIFVSMTPLVTVMLAFVMRTEEKNYRKLVGVLVGTVALMPLMLSEDMIMPRPEEARKGFILALLVACCYGLYHNLVSKFWPDGEDTWQLATGETVAGLFVLVPFALLVYGFEPLPFHGYVMPVVLGGYLLLSIISIWLYFYVLKAGGPIFTSMAGFISLVAGVVFGMVLFGERHTPWVLFSMLAMVVAIWLTIRQGEDKNEY